MKYFLTGKKAGAVKNIFSAAGCTGVCTPEEADFIVAYGGDGSLLQACSLYFFKPVLALRDTLNSALCSRHDHADIIRKFLKGDLQGRELPFISGECDGVTVYGINDIFVHNSQRGNALRYAVRIDGKPYASGIIGDAVGIATVHGATAYYRSITRSIFRVGMGLAFSNSTELVNHLVIPCDSVVDVEIIRGPAVMQADNSTETVTIPQNHSVTLRQSQRKATVFALDEFMCPRCRELRHPRPVEE